MPRPFPSHRTWLRLLTALALTALLLIVFFFLTSKKSFIAEKIIQPFDILADTGRQLQSKESLERENNILRKKVSDLSLEISQFEELRRENKRLRELLQFKERFGFDTVSAEIIARDPNDWTGSFIIDKGSQDGVSKDSAVCSAQGLLGRVTEPGSNTSKVMLLTHPSFRIGGTLKDTRISGIVVGSGKGSAKMLYLPVDSEVNPGDAVITSGFSRIFPKGIVIGTVVSLEKSKTGLYKYAILRPSASSFRQEEVLCIK